MPVLLLLTGCGASSTVSGKVLFKGEPLKQGTVTFVAEDNRAYSSPIGQDGRYTIEKIPPGPVKIGVSVPEPPVIPKRPGAGKVGGFDKIKLPEDAPNPFAFDRKGGVSIPAHYRDPARSNLEYTVVAGSQDHNIELKADASSEQKKTK
jgi:hypothetical protein